MTEVASLICWSYLFFGNFSENSFKHRLLHNTRFLYKLLCLFETRFYVSLKEVNQLC